MKGRIKSFYLENEKWIALGLFVGGFLFDIITLSAVDDVWNLLQQGAYLLILSFLLFAEVLHHYQSLKLPTWLQKPWEYREAVIHFLFGSLLSLYSLFYFKSASLAASFLFMILLCGLLVANELPQFQRRGPVVRLALLSLCYSSFFAILFPLVFGFIGWIPFLFALSSGSLLIWLLRKYLLRRLLILKESVNTLFLPALGVQVLFLFFYLIKVIPPVPLAVTEMGIYHDVSRQAGQYKLSHERPFWRFWQSGDQWFEARAGDKLFVFAKIFCPTRLSEQVSVRWLFKDPKQGWVTSDVIPLNIAGGREDGYRGFAYKTNYQPGDWRVLIETSDGREVARVGFSVELSAGSDIRQFREEWR